MFTLDIHKPVELAAYCVQVIVSSRANEPIPLLKSLILFKDCASAASNPNLYFLI